MITPISAPDLAQWLGDAQRTAPQIIDVREDWEYALCHLTPAQHIPMQDIPSRLNEIDDDRPVVLLCHHGVRSYHVALFLQQQGFAPLFNLTGGINAWAKQVDINIPQY